MLAGCFLFRFSDVILAVDELSREAWVFGNEEVLREFHVIQYLFMKVFDFAPSFIGETLTFSDFLFGKLHKAGVNDVANMLKVCCKCENL